MELKLKYLGKRDLNVDCSEIRDVVDELGKIECQSKYLQKDGDALFVDNFFVEENRVSDVSRYCVRTGGSAVGKYRICEDKHIVRHCDVPEQHMQTNVGSIVLLLESPHKDEYKYECGNIVCPIVPANGKAGTGIDKSLCTVLLHIQEMEDRFIKPGYQIVISNPIQFQASLYAVHRKPLSKDDKWRKLRDKTWSRLWQEEDVRRCFRRRLERYDPKIIISACTKNLRACVNSVIKEYCASKEQEVPLYEVTHPSMWQDLRPGRISWSPEVG